MSIHAVIWDVGGVLVRTEDLTPRQQLAKEYDLSWEEIENLVFGSPENNVAQLGEISHAEHWKIIGDKLNLPPEKINGFEAQFFAGDSIDQGLISLIREIKTGRCTAILSNAFSNLRKVLEDDWQIDDAFNEIVISAEVGLMKPDLSIYELTLEKIGFEPEEALFIDDMIQNVEAAKEVGLHAIRFESARQIRQEVFAKLNLH